jgi:hypothetical protein
MNGFSMLATGTLLRDEDAELGYDLGLGADFTRAELGRAVTPSSRIRNRLMACRADIGSEVVRSTSKIKGQTQLVLCPKMDMSTLLSTCHAADSEALIQSLF